MTRHAAPAFPSAIVAVLAAVLASAQPAFGLGDPGDEPAWLSLERGKRAYADKDFGAAIVYFDAAIEKRRTVYEAAEARLGQVRTAKAAMGESIRNSLSAFAAEDFIQRDYAALSRGREPTSSSLLADLRKERISDSHRAFIDVLLAVLEYRDIASLGDSMAELALQVHRLRRYPEAEYWKGRVFFVEGELSLAEAQFERAYAMADSLDVGEERYTVLYALAGIYELRDNRVAWENALRRISDELEVGIDAYLRSAMLSTLLESGFERFMTLYRLDALYSLRANAELAFFYLERGRAQALERSAVAVNMVVTKAIAMMKAREPDYTWLGLEDFLRRGKADAAVSRYLDEVEAFRLLLGLGDALYIAGARAPAAYLWRNVASWGPSPQAAVARSRLVSPASAVRREAPSVP